MSIDETGKGPCRKIDALFEDNTNLNLIDAMSFRAGNLKSVDDDHEMSILDKELDTSESKSKKCYRNMKKCEYNFSLLTHEIPSDVCYGKELSSRNGQSFLSSTTAEYQDSLSKSDAKFLDTENLSFDIINPVSVNSFDETKMFEGLDTVHFIETILGDKSVDVRNVPETVCLKFQVSDTAVSSSLKSSKVSINSSKMKIGQADEVTILNEPFQEKFDKENSFDSKRTDSKVKTLRFDDSDRQSEMGDDTKSMESESLRDLYFEHFVENFNKEEMEYRWGRYDPSVRRRYYQNSPKTKSGGENGLKYEKVQRKTKIGKTAIAGIESVDVKINQNSLQALTKKNFTTEVAVSDIWNESSKTFARNTDYSFGENNSKKNVIVDGASKQPIICENFTTENSRRNSFIRIKDLEQETNIYLCDTIDDDEVVFERAVKIIRTYRNICSFIERFFVRPFASVIDECLDLVIFVLIMGFCLFYLFYENVIEKKLNFAHKFVLRYNKMLKTKNRIIESSYDDSHDKTNSEVLQTKEAGSNEEKGFKFTAVNEETDTNAVDEDISFIDPTDVLRITNLEAVEESFLVEKFILKAEEFIELFNREKQTAFTTSYENCLVNIIFKADMLNENYFDEDIVASSQIKGNELNESKEGTSLKVFKNSFSSNATSRETEKAHDSSIVFTEDAKLLPIKNKSADSSQEECFQNSIEIEDSKLIARAASGSSSGSDFNILSSSCVNLLSSGTVQSSNENLPFCSSLSVNLPSFCSGSEVNLINESLSISNTLKDVYDGILSSLNDCSGTEKKLEVDGNKSSPVVNLTESEDLVKIQIGDNTGDSFKNKTFFRKISPKRFKLKSLKKLQITCQQELEYTKFDSPNIVAESQNNLYNQSENLDSEASEFVEIQANGNINSELDSLMEPSLLPREKKIFSGNLRRRVSSIFSGWKKMQMMQSVTENLKSKGYPSIKMSKKHNKNLEKP